MERKDRTHARRKTLALCCASALLCTAVLGDEITNSIPWLKPYQRRNIGVQPLAPDEFNPDAGVRLPANFIDDAVIAYQLKRRTNTVAPATAPPFNPDPGASLKRPVEAPKPFFQYDYVPLPVFSGESISDELKLPRAPVHQTELLLREPEAPPPVYGFEPLTNGLALPRASTIENTSIPTHWRILDYPISDRHRAPADSIAMTNRYRVPFVPWRRYTSGDIETPYQHERPFHWHPYFQSVLKGDSPIIGQDIFLNLTAGTSTEVEFRRIPTPSAISSARPGSSEFFGKSEQWSVQNNLSLTIDLFRGETVFKPVEWAVRIQPVYNINFVDVEETTVVRPDPRGYDRDNRPVRGNRYGVNNPGDVSGVIPGVTPVGSDLSGRSHTQRTKDFFALQEAFAEVHIRDLSDNYDFIAARVGNQTFNSDFRGFIFNDVNTGARLFGNWDNNHWQYNAIAFDMREKDTYSDLNSLDDRDQRVAILNVYRQDAIWKGYTAQASLHGNFDDENGTHYDRNGNIVRPAPFGSPVPHEVNAVYFGWAGDGHIGRWNISHQFYQAVGHDTFNGLAGQPVNINAQMAALEISYDRDWMRYKASFFYASGDSDAEDDEATGFDTILDNPNFTGGPFSYWVRQGFNLGGTAVNLKQRNSLVPNLRTSKTQGQANFVNPGVFIYSLGLEIDTTPKLRTFLNANYIRLAETDSIKTALLTDEVREEIGWDLSVGWQYRPFLTDNAILSAGFGALIPGSGFRDIYRRNTSPVPGYNSPNRSGDVDDFLYSAVMALTLTY